MNLCEQNQLTLVHLQGIGWSRNCLQVNYEAVYHVSAISANHSMLSNLVSSRVVDLQKAK